MIVSRRNLYLILVPGLLLSLLTIGLSIGYGEFETTLIGPGDDVRFGTWHLNTGWEWGLWFALQLSLGVLDVFFYEFVQPHFNLNINDDTYPITQYGKGERKDICRMSCENTLAFFPNMIRLTLGVLFINTQILSVIVVQCIKEVVIFFMVYYKLKNKQKMFKPREDIELSTPLILPNKVKMRL